MGLRTVLALGTCVTVGIMAISQAQPALALSSDASLDLLVISPGVLTPAFDSGTMAYTSVVPSTTATLSVTPTAAAGATVTVNGATVVSGSPSPTIALTVGANSITTVVTAGNGVTQRTYTLTVQRSTTADPDLSGLRLSSGVLTPVFAKGTILYTAEVPFSAKTITLSPTASASTSTVKVNGSTVAPGGQSDPIDLAVGDNDITVTVRAQDLSQKRYTVTVKRASEVELLGLRLSSGTLSPAFGGGITEYTATVPDATKSIAVTPTGSSTLVTMKVNGAVVPAGGSSGEIPLTTGANTVTIIVTTTDNQTKTSKVVVTRAPGAAVSPDGVHLGGGVWLVRTGTFSHLKVTRAAAGTTAKAKKKQSVRTPLNRLVAPRVRNLTPRTAYRVSVRINGSWIQTGTLRAGRQGVATLPALRFQNAGRFQVKLRASDQSKRYIRIVAHPA
jgi:Cadherin-like beta sandwich domain